METEIYHSIDHTGQYTRMLEHLYGAHDAFTYYANDITKALQYSSAKQSPDFIAVLKNGDCIGHVALLKEHGLSEGAAFFGFFECSEDDVFAVLWDMLVSQARSQNISRLVGPVNGSIWHQYRVISTTSGDDYFPSEPITNHMYADFLRSKLPVKEIVYHSAYRKNYQAIINLTSKAYEKAVSDGITIRRITDPDFNLIKSLFTVSKTIFKDNWGYTDLSLDEFIALYGTEKIRDYIGSVYTVSIDDRLFGFCINICYGKTLVMKTMGIIPELQGKGIGNALVHRIHKEAASDGISRVIYALVKKDNKVKYFPTDDIKVFREYSAFEFEV